MTAYLKLHNVQEATEHKHRIEQRQRDDAKQRLETGETWDTRVTVLLLVCMQWHAVNSPDESCLLYDITDRFLKSYHLRLCKYSTSVSVLPCFLLSLCHPSNVSIEDLEVWGELS